MIPRHLVIAVAVLLMIVLGMAVYAWQMRGRAAAVPVATSDARPLAPPSAGPTEQLTLFVAYDDPGILRAQSARIPLPAGRQQRAEELLRALLALYLDKSSPHAIGVGAEEWFAGGHGLAVRLCRGRRQADHLRLADGGDLVGVLRG